VDDTKSSSCRKLGPIHSLPKPFQIITEELIIRCSLIHKRIAKGDCRVKYRISPFKTVPNLVENAQIGVVVSVEEFKV
jgi:hypothetical protein